MWPASFVCFRNILSPRIIFWCYLHWFADGLVQLRNDQLWSIYKIRSLSGAGWSLSFLAGFVATGSPASLTVIYILFLRYELERDWDRCSNWHTESLIVSFSNNSENCLQIILKSFPKFMQENVNLEPGVETVKVLSKSYLSKIKTSSKEKASYPILLPSRTVRRCKCPINAGNHRGDQASNQVIRVYTLSP